MDRLAVVSGGGTGIGRGIAAALAAAGDDVVIIGRRPDPLAAAAAAINADTGAKRVRLVTADLSVPAQAEMAAGEITGTGREVDVLVNNAGGNVAPFPAEDLAGIRDDWQANLNANVLPAVLLTQALLPAIRRPGGRIVTVTSIAAFRGPATYGGAKAALHPWSAALALRLAPDGITVNVVAPGYVAGTEFYGERMSPDFHDGRARQAPMHRGGDVAEIAATVAHLAGPDAGFITGQVIQINGGALLGRG
jgi:3-oxoacyl-[acyl-carrier protein] reductase